MKDYNFCRNHLPHINFPGAIQFVTFRLKDSLPVELINAGLREKEKSLDQHYGSCVLRIPAAAKIVEDELLQHSGQTYILLEYVIMPNHVHVLILVLEGFFLWQIIKSWKARSALRINQHRSTTGSLWQKDSFDRYVRDDEHYEKNKALYSQ